ncbi:hypothetical protein CS8_010020 [Cupriavidus sp. 8B]
MKTESASCPTPTTPVRTPFAPRVPVWGKTRRTDGTFPKVNFRWDEQANEYSCPGGNALRSDWRAYTNPRTHVTKTDTVIYRASRRDCGGCVMKDQCCPNMPFRKIACSVHENACDVERKLAATPEFKQSRRQRNCYLLI